MLQVSLEQSEEMMAAFSAWKIIYWEPHLAQNSPRTSGRPARGDASSRGSAAMTIPSR
jgi:hypothetical protein